MSQASRSNQSAAGQTGRTLATGSPSSSQTWTRSRAGESSTRRRWYETENRFGFGSGTRASPLDPGSFRSRPDVRPDVARDLLLAPAEVVGGGDVAEEVEAVLVAEHGARLHEPRRVDDERRLAECLARLDHARDARVRRHSATPRISYAGGTPPRIFS